jgi:von Willebrand factor A domain-containing protein 8
LIQSAWAGRLVHLAGIDVIGSTAGSLARLLQDRESELWEGKRVVARSEDQDKLALMGDVLTNCDPSFRIITTASRSLPLRDWLTDEHANMFGAFPSLPMSPSEELEILLDTGCKKVTAVKILEFAASYRESMNASTRERANRRSDDGGLQKNRRLGTRALVRIAQRCAHYPWDEDLYTLFARTLLIEFLPVAERNNVENLLKECGIVKQLELVILSTQLMFMFI